MANKVFSVAEVEVNRSVPPYDGLMGVMNEATDGTVLEVRHAWLAAQSAISDVAGTPGRVKYSRISAVSGGDEISFAKCDTNSSSLPAQVKLWISPTSVTETSALFYRSNTRCFGETLANNYAVMNASYLGTPGNCGHDYANHLFRGRDGSVESWTCRAGEGLAMILNTVGFPTSWSLRVCVRDLSTNKSYVADVEPALVEHPRGTGDAYWALMNAAGSGVTIEVTIVDMNEVGYTNVIPEYSLVKGDCVGTNRRVIACIARDSADVCPTGVYGVVAPFYVQPEAADHGAPYDIPQFGPQAANGVPIAQQLKYSRYRHVCYVPILRVTTAPAYRFGQEEKLLFDVPSNMDGIFLSRGEGIAIVQRSSALLNRSCLMPVQGSITFIARTPAAPVGGGTCYVTNRIMVR